VRKETLDAAIAFWLPYETRERTPFPRTGPHSESLAHEKAAVVVAQLQTSGDAGLKSAEVLGDMPGAEASLYPAMDQTAIVRLSPCLTH
jgi:hypothetical protein